MDFGDPKTKMVINSFSLYVKCPVLWLGLLLLLIYSDSNWIFMISMVILPHLPHIQTFSYVQVIFFHYYYKPSHSTVEQLNGT